MAADGEFGGQVTEGPQPLAAGGACVMVIGADRGGSRPHLEEIRERLAARGIRVAASSIWRFYDRHGISFKKNRARRGAAAPGCGERPAGVENRAPAET